MKLKIILILFFVAGISFHVSSQPASRSFYNVKIYHFESQEQEDLIDGYLKTAFIPALHRNGIEHIGVFKPVGNDTLQDKRICVLIPFRSVQQFADLPEQLAGDKRYLDDGKLYLEAAYSRPAYGRIESILIKAFTGMPGLQTPVLKSEPSKRIYELRSYEGPTERLHERKVHMFNEGGEISLFKKLNFNAVFYGSVISGSRMPNLMYMTSFEDMGSRDEHWKAFFSSPEWKELSSMDYYRNSVSKSDIILMHPADYSEI